METSGSEITYLMFWIVDCVGYQLSMQKLELHFNRLENKMESTDKLQR